MDSAIDLLEAAPEGAEAAAEPRPNKPPVIRIAPDGMSATAELAGACSEWELRQALKSAGVVYGIDADSIQMALRQAGNPSPTVVARGVPAEAPQDAALEYLFQAGKPRLIERGGRVDWHELNLLESVAAGAQLAIKRPAVQGKPGKTVRGVELRVRTPRECRIALGQGAVLSPDDPNTVVAAVAGVVRLDSNGKIAVDNTFVVNGDVDLTLGNLDVEGSLIVRGTVREGFCVKANGNVEIDGMVEKASVVAGGSVMVKGPVFGSISHPDSVEVIGGHRQITAAHDWPHPAATIHAGQDIVAQFADNAVLVAGRDVLLQQEALHCNIEAEGRVVVGGDEPSSGGIIGGFVRAAQGITVYDLGSLGRTPTRVRAGYDWLLPGKVQAIEAELGTVEQRLTEVTVGLKAIVQARAKGALNTAQRIAAEELRLALPGLQHAARELKSRRQGWAEASKTPSSIRVYGTARATTELTIDGTSQRIERDARAICFVVEEEHITDHGLN